MLKMSSPGNKKYKPGGLYTLSNSKPFWKHEYIDFNCDEEIEENNLGSIPENVPFILLKHNFRYKYSKILYKGKIGIIWESYQLLRKM